MAWKRRAAPVALAGVVALVLTLAGCVRPGTGPAPLPTATGGPVTLHTDAASYRAGDTLRATLANEGEQAILYDSGQRAVCAALERRELGGWSRALTCPELGMVGGFDAVMPGQTETLSMPLPPDLQAGTYRLTLRYIPRDVVVNQATVIHSAGFEVT